MKEKSIEKWKITVDDMQSRFKVCVWVFFTIRRSEDVLSPAEFHDKIPYKC